MSLVHSATRRTSSLVDFDTVLPDMQTLVLDYLATHEQVTFVDMEEDIPGFEGEFTLRDSSNRNAILWRGLSASALCAIHTLEQQKKITLKPVSPALYQRKGRRIQLPVSKVKLGPWRWIPVVLELTAEGLAQVSIEEETAAPESVQA